MDGLRGSGTGRKMYILPVGREDGGAPADSSAEREGDAGRSELTRLFIINAYFLDA
jgi:hypothetical protein